MIHEVTVVGPFQANCWVLAEEGTGEAVVIDPGDEPRRILRVVEGRGLHVRAILLTHAHLDHVCGAAGVREATGAPVALHPGDRQLYENVPRQAAAFGLDAEAPPPVERWLADGDRIAFGALAAEVIHTPGHSPGGVCFQVGAAVFAGDTLFAGSVGRTDLWGGSARVLMESIRGRLMALPDGTDVFPGHGPATTIGEERRSNPFVAGR